MEVVADTTVFIDLYRNRRRPHALKDLRNAVGDATLLVSPIVQGEFARGAYFRGAEEEELKAFFDNHVLLSMTQEVIHLYGRTWAEMRKRKETIDYPDLWIAAAGLERETPVVTRNPGHFEKVTGLEVIAYELV